MSDMRKLPNSPKKTLLSNKIYVNGGNDTGALLIFIMVLYQLRITKRIKDTLMSDMRKLPNSPMKTLLSNKIYVNSGNDTGALLICILVLA